MKYEAIFYNKTDNVINFVSKFNNKYYGYSIKKGIVQKINLNILCELSKILFFNNNCKYLENYKEYQVYYDDENNLKHFIKNGKEDLDLFIKFNTKECIYCLDKKSKVKYYTRLETPKKITTKDWIMTLTREVLAIMLIIEIPLSTYGLEFATTVDSLSSILVYDVISEMNVDLNKVSKKDCINLILESKYLSEELKMQFTNKDLFDDIFPYYENTCMEYLLKDKLTNLHVKEYGKTNIYYYNPNIAAYYTPLYPNRLNDRKDNYSFKDFAGHEYIHLLQNPLCELDYIMEATAAILHYEYFDVKDHSYNKGQRNIRLLMDVTGPKIIFQYIFACDIGPLETILKENLSQEDYNRIMELFYYKSNQLNEEQNKEIENIIGKLYYNIYNMDIKKDINIYYPSGEFIDGRIYCNRRKMQDEFKYNCTKQLALDAGIITENIWYIKKVPDDKLEEYKNNPNVRLSSYTTYINCESIDIDANDRITLKVEDGSIITLAIEEAYKLGYLKEEMVIFVKKEDLEDYAFLEDFKYPFKDIDFNYPNVSYSLNADEEFPVNVTVLSIASRFPNEMVNTFNNDEFNIKM